MLRTLLESQAATPRRTGGTMVSIALHVGGIALAIVATASATTAREHDVVRPDITYVAPPAPRDPTPSRAPDERTSGPVVVVPTKTVVPPITIPDRVPPIDFNRPPTDERDWDGKTARLTRGSFDGGDGLASPTDGVYTSALVEKAAAPQPGNPAPVYPSALRSAQIEGTVLATFVVDTSGRAEPATIHFTEATHPQFADAVRQSLLRSRYLPAIVASRPVRQLVEQRFAFTLTR